MNNFIYKKIIELTREGYVPHNIKDDSAYCFLKDELKVSFYIDIDGESDQYIEIDFRLIETNKRHRADGPAFYTYINGVLRHEGYWELGRPYRRGHNLPHFIDYDRLGNVVRSAHLNFNGETIWL